ncbi:type 1 fimbria pilin [Dyella sp. SG562]|uniref:fimbrial protein n=1 Tax=unclassified Dyella TaxID=2634549 RepID=UPI00141ED554|nr:type 1 fimbrial protein [Dyella sp. SG562]NII74058.1 type 1 fimbria pilin [Dyella sp. SG562]
MQASKWMPAVAMWLLMILVIAHPGIASATKASNTDLCTTSGLGSLPGTTQQGPITALRDIPIGSVLPGGRTNLHITVTCKAGSFDTSSNVVNMAMIFSGTATAVPNMTNVYTQSSSVAGVGFRILNAAGQAVALGPISTDSCTHAQAFLIGTGTNASTTFSFDGAFELVKIGSTMSKGSQTVKFVPGACGQAWGNNNSTASDWRVASEISNPALTTCTVSSHDNEVAMPTMASSSMASVGSVAGVTAFTIGLQCSEGAMLYMTLTDSTAPGNTGDKLTPASNSTARGVAFQISRGDGTVVSYGPDSSVAGNTHQFQIGASVGGLMQVPFKAAYIRTGMVNPGSLMGKATFTLSYQ